MIARFLLSLMLTLSHGTINDNNAVVNQYGRLNATGTSPTNTYRFVQSSQHHEKVPVQDDGAFVFQDAIRNHIVGPGPDNNFFLTIFFRFTITFNGEATGMVTRVEVECR